MKASAELMRVLYDPAAWADQAWFEHYGADVRWPRRLANRVLLRRAPIAHLKHEECSCARIKWLVGNWGELPALAYLAGARLARDAIASRNGLLSLRWRAANFVALPLFTPTAGAISGRTSERQDADEDIHSIAMAQGARCLLNAMYGTAPGWKQRIRLRLPPASLPDRNSDSASAHETSSALAEKLSFLPNIRSEQIASLQLLKFAASFHHAQKY